MIIILILTHPGLIYLIALMLWLSLIYGVKGIIINFHNLKNVFKTSFNTSFSRRSIRVMKQTLLSTAWQNMVVYEVIPTTLQWLDGIFHADFHCNKEHDFSGQTYCEGVKAWLMIPFCSIKHQYISNFQLFCICTSYDMLFIIYLYLHWLF